MVVKKRGTLGSKGIEALLAATQGVRELEEIKISENPAQYGLFEVDVKKLSPSPYQPRRVMREEELNTLASSIRSQGILQPIVVRTKANGHYEIIAGERRWRAAQLANLARVPVVVKEVPDESAMAIALIENIQRENLNPLEEAEALDRLSKKFNLTHNEVAEAVGKSRATVTNLLRLLGLNPEAKALLEAGRIEAGHGKVLLGLKGLLQTQMAQTIAEKGLSVRETERLVASKLDRVSQSRSTQPTKDPDVRRLENSLSEKLGAVIEISQGPNGKGKLIIQYNSLDELEGILAHIH